MRLSAARCFVAAVSAALAGCHSDQPPLPPPSSVSPQAVAPLGKIRAAPASSPAPLPAVSRRIAQKSAPSAQDVAQVDLNSEGGVRDGSYAMWVHVAEDGKPLKSINVVAYDPSDKPVSAARTNEEGDAMLRVQATTYRIAASKGRARAERTVTFHPGDQYELDLTP